MAEEIVQRGFRVEGRVQGVGFRWWAKQAADELGVSGTVRNLPDGAVEVHARAAANVLEVFEARLHEGPWAARVEAVTPGDSQADLPAAFEIRR